MSYDTERYYNICGFLSDQEVHKIWNIIDNALETLISNINNQFYYIGEEDDKVAPIDVKKFTEHCVAFIDSLEIEKWPQKQKPKSLSLKW